MKKTALIASYLLVTSSVFAAEPVKFIIYPNLAIVSFMADVDKEAAIQIPAAFNPESVKFVSAEGATLISFNAEMENAVHETPQYLIKMKKEIDDLFDLINKKTAKLSGIDLSAVLLDNLNADNLKPSEIQSFITQAATLREKTAKEALELNEELKTLNAILKLKQENYMKKLPANHDKRTVVKVKLSGKGKIIFQAETNKVSWEPYYDMNINSQTGLIATTLSIVMRQNTGIQWKGLMEFYSSQPSKNINFYNVQPLVVAFAPKTPTSPQPRALYQKQELSLETNEFADAKMAAVAHAPKIIDSGIYFKINANITGDGAEEKVSLEKFNIPSKAGFEISPEFSKNAFLIANITNSPKPFLKSKAEFFVDGKYSSSGILQSLPQGSTLTIPFSESQNITATRKNVISNKDTSWGKGVVKNGYIIEVINGLEKNVSVTVNDRIPFSADSKISVTNISIDPKTVAPKEGVYKWELTLKPKETKKIEVKYEIKYPNDESIIFR